jgi:hypothetical protein
MLIISVGFLFFLMMRGLISGIPGFKDSISGFEA